MLAHHFASAELSAGPSLLLLHAAAWWGDLQEAVTAVLAHAQQVPEFAHSRNGLLHTRAFATELLQSARQASAAKCRLENPVMKHLIQGAYGW